MHDINNTIGLLEKAKAILHLRNRRPKKPGEDFNVFTVLQLNEVEHCRLLYELLDPKGSHGMGDCFLRSFFKLVLDKPYPATEVYVERERTFPNGRIDLLIEGAGFCYPIEVKIYAGDQQAQLARYDKFAAKEAEEHQVYYLTLYGKEPSEQSRGDANVTCLSFKNICKWLERCGEEALLQPALAEIIRQYIKLLNEITGQMQEEVYMIRIRNKITESQENYESAVAIANSLPRIKAEMMERVFREIEAHIGDRLEPLYSDYHNSVAEYYRPYKRSWPGFTYRLTERDGVALSFEVGDELYWGITFCDGEKHIKRPKEGLTELLYAAFPNTDWQNIKLKADDWWLWREYLPADRNMRLNFKECNGVYPQLYDENGFNKVMRRIFDQIDGRLEHIIETGLYE